MVDSPWSEISLSISEQLHFKIIATEDLLPYRSAPDKRTHKHNGNQNKRINFIGTSDVFKFDVQEV